jgi:nitrile hydratase beta subunit-like protein
VNPRFAPGERVRVRESASTGHVRTPDYIRGKRGVVERICGRFRRPEELAYGRYDGNSEALYRVRFAQREVWPGYAGAAEDTLDVELYEGWLQRSEDGE